VNVEPVDFFRAGVSFLSAVNVAEQPEDDDEDENGRKTAAAQLPSGEARDDSAQRSLHKAILLSFDDREGGRAGESAGELSIQVIRVEFRRLPLMRGQNSKPETKS
jgi:hypothetical protein